MSGMFFPEPRHNPEYEYFLILSGYNANFSSITQSIDTITGGTGFSGGTIASSINVLGNVTGNNLYISSTSIVDIFISTGDTLDGGFW